MNFYDEVPFKPKLTSNASRINLVCGDSWSAWQEDNDYLVEYISGELGGKLKKIKISEHDFLGLINGSLGIDAVCIKYDKDML
jgi:hypothetical protein